MGHRFVEGTVPQLVRELQRLNGNLERLVATAELLAGQKQSSGAEPVARTPGDSEGR
ncbi:hypothetical protein STIAU_1357 [Stigmatella aurantiaca DW4/3-1]|nr:hypothetical protein STIAU_1357 [Stigmatella aurantiaca DW4/3-1]